jgi:hypothetical protein
MSNDVADRIRAKVTRAHQHIQDFDLGVRAFFDTKPYTVAVKENPNGGYPIYYLAGLKPPPHTLAATGADAVQNLRSALDTIAYQLVLAAHYGIMPDPKWKIYFPFSKSASDYKATRRGQIKGVRQEIVDAIDANEPYKCGKGHALWQLQQLSNPDKHELPLSIGSYSRGVGIAPDFEHSFRQAAKDLPNLAAAFEGMSFPQIFLKPANPLLSLKVGDELFIGPAEPEMVEKRQFTFDIAIDAPGVVEPEPAVVTLKNIANFVGDIVGELTRFLR